MNLSPQWLEILHNAGIGAEHWAQVGKPNATDLEIFKYARAKSHVILTQDLDFSQILFETAASGPSTILLRIGDEFNVENQQRIVKSILQCEAELKSGALLVIDDRRARIRLLPI